MYDRTQVRALLPAVWDDSYAFGLDYSPETPDPDMPRASRNVAHSNTYFAMIADIKSAWKRGDLTLKQRRAIFMHYAFGITETAIAAYEGVSQQAISMRIDVGVGRLVEYLTGDVLVGDDDDDEEMM